MAGGNHLWEIDQNWFLVIVDHDVELIKIAVDDTVVCQFQQQIHQFFKQSACIVQFS